MKTRTLFEKPWLVETLAAAWDQILDLGRRVGNAMDRKEAELDDAGLWEQMKFTLPVIIVGMYIGIGALRCLTAVLVDGTKVPLDMVIDWWWVALMN